MILLLLGCSGTTSTEAPPTPEPTGLSDCAVCGMTVREQPAPRGQVQHRDGTHAHLCSLGDLEAYVAAPNPHGKPVGVWVEALPAGFDPLAPAGPQLPWIRAEDASYVVGVERPLVMGKPMLSYGDAETADAEAARLGGVRTYDIIDSVNR